ncbi:MAG TPA: hypothetical protein ENH86_02050 [Candidatus Jorgensenbacteria bacterium]|uniref:Uncharacterized protein n=1 Tax=marine sediment metagenome TaxID=412755 RepID=A0A0F9NQZ5_9ZZZZ|nr:hypothetical protein [Candidatus Jorgensenbacteria bacterium]
MNQETKTCQNCKQEFTIEPDDFAFYKKMDTPPPTFCPDCREQRRLAFRNERALYKRKCDLCGKEVVSRVSSDAPYQMYCQKCWWSDTWDPLEYGKDYDFSKPFFEQFKELLQKTPHIALLNFNTVNSEWVNQETDVKNCYLEVGGHFNEDSAYNTYLLHGKDCFDNYWVMHSELCYECINCERCYRTIFSRDCFNCRNVTLSFNCRNCSDVFGCAGLRNKRYYIFNKPYSKEEYEKFIKENPITSHENLKKIEEKAQEVRLSIPHRDRFVVKSTHVSGNRILESKNTHNCWSVENMENVKNFYIALQMKDSYDGSSIAWGELVYENAHSGGVYNTKFSAFNFGAGGSSGVQEKNTSYLEYCHTAPGSNYCFGCVNLKKQEYCILNKKYSKEEYEVLIPKIKEHMNTMPYIDSKGRTYAYGEFFPSEFSPYGYNETAAMDFYPLTKKEALEKGYLWSDYEQEIHHEFSDYKIPDDIKDVKDDVLKKVLKDEVTDKAYRLIPMELQFYRRMGIPIPRRSPLQRHKDRIAKLLPRKLFDGKCQCAGEQSDSKVYMNTSKNHQPHEPSEHCPNTFKTPYSSNKPEIVYCEQCYQAEIS